jgi:hypothetical protein
MAKLTAGTIIRFTLNGQLITARIEDGSKSDIFLAKVETSESPDHKPGQVYEFTRDVLDGN